MKFPYFFVHVSNATFLLMINSFVKKYYFEKNIDILAKYDKEISLMKLHDYVMKNEYA